jgi:uncharacterized membrane protein YadS
LRFKKEKEKRKFEARISNDLFHVQFLLFWQLNTLGLLPTHASDWVSSLPPAKVHFFFAMISTCNQAL